MSEILIPSSLLPKDGRFGCGPSKIRPEQLAFNEKIAQSVLGTSHRQAPVKNLVASIQNELLVLFNAPEGYEILLGNGGATAFWDAAVHGLIKNKSQHLAFGEFGAKFATAAKNAPFLEDPDIREAAAGSRSHAEEADDVDVYAYPQNETSTGVMVPIERIGDPQKALTVVDATSGAGGIAFDPANVDVYYFSPQKNFAADGGIWFALASPRAVERIEEIAANGRYIPDFLNLKNAVTNSRLNQTLNTPALSTLALMDEQVRWINSNGGLSWASERTSKSSGLLYDWAEKSEVASPFVADPADRSQVVVTIDFTDSVDAKKISSVLRANGIVDTEPYRKLGRNQLRIATFTAIDPADIEALIGSIDYVLERI